MASTQPEHQSSDGVRDAAGAACPIAPPGRLRHATASRVLAGVIALAVMLIYFATAAPNAFWGDGLELAAAARVLGVPHPTGYPLYMMLGHGLMRLAPEVDPGRVLTLANAALLAGACWLLLLFFRNRMLEFAAEPPKDGACPCAMAPFSAALGVALLLALARTVWEHATITEVYPLTYALGALTLWLAWPVTPAAIGRGRAAALGAVLGLAALNHYSIIALAPLGMLALIEWGPRRGGMRPRTARLVGIAALCGALALLGYLYLPLRARANPPLNWGDPSNLERLWWVLRGGQFTELRVGGGGAAAGLGLLRWLHWWGSQWIPERHAGLWLTLPLGGALLAAALAGLWRAGRARPLPALGCALAIAATAAFGAFYHIQDIDAYFIIALPSAAVGWIAAGQGLGAWLARRGSLVNPRLLRLFPLVVAIAALAGGYRTIDKSWDTGPLDWGAGVLARLPQGAIVLTGQDNDIYALWYQQIALGQRPDVSVVGGNFLSSPWYARYFESAGRPRIELTLRERIPVGKDEFDVAVYTGLLRENLAKGKRIFVTYHDPWMEHYFRSRPIGEPLFRPIYRELTAYRLALPSPVLYELTRNPALESLTEEQLRAEFAAFEARQARGRPPGQR